MSTDEDDSVYVSVRWFGAGAPSADVIDDTSRDSGISVTETTSADDDACHEFSVPTALSQLSQSGSMASLPACPAGYVIIMCYCFFSSLILNCLCGHKACCLPD